MDVDALTAALTTAFKELDLHRTSLPPFDPSKQDINDWILTFNSATANKTDEQKINYLPSVLQNTALQWYATRKRTQSNESDWKSWETALIAEFGKKLPAILQELNTRQQRQNEQTIDYCRDILRLCSLCNPLMTETEKIAHLTRGISPALKGKVILMNANTSSDFIDNVRFLESHKDSSQPNDQSRIIETLALALIEKTKSEAKDNQNAPQLFQQSIRPMDEEIRKIHGQLQRLQEEIAFLSNPGLRQPFTTRPFNQRYPNRQAQVTRLCYQCNRQGHLARDCWFRENGQRNQRSRSKSPQPLGNGNRRIDFDTIVDTGSRKNIVSQDFVQKLNLIASQDDPTLLKVVNGATVKPKGKVKFQILIGDRFYDVCALIVQNFPYDILLGNEFCASENVIIDFKTKKIKIKSFEYPIDDSFFTSTSSFVNVPEDTVIPRTCEIALKVICYDNLNGDIIIEPSSTAFQRYGIVVCKTSLQPFQSKNNTPERNQNRNGL
ncbi:hypothetical protein B4U79_18337 [Dinothrombium tinctorium]|uniref:CCHC-type domain-containing protein n=1 Tax=Dinothrombium tinctorium TaxID=1965070 RepID=A0A443QPR9_9ACAR|nr:hypothetical protein B4U79_18337 [Dinothrombium tinctorium]